MRERLRFHKSFFRKICRSKIDKIYSFGFAFADVDLPYIEKICSLIDTRDITWHLNDYDCIQKRKEYQKKLKKCGFQGKFSTFTTK